MNELTLPEKASTSLDFSGRMTESFSSNFWATHKLQISRYQLKQVADTEMMIPVDMRGVGEVSLRRGRVGEDHSRLLRTVHAHKSPLHPKCRIAPNHAKR